MLTMQREAMMRLALFSQFGIALLAWNLAGAARIPAAQNPSIETLTSTLVSTICSLCVHFKDTLC